MTGSGERRRLRPRYLALIFAGYFVTVTVLAWDTARWTSGPWYDPLVSQMVYQTMLLAGIFLLMGLLILAITVDRLDRLARGAARDTASLISALSEVVHGAEGESLLEESRTPSGPLIALSGRLSVLMDDLGSPPVVAEETRRELTWLVEEMRGLFIAATRIGLDITGEKQLLASTVAASDQEDMSQHLDLLAMEIPPLREGLKARIAGSLQILLNDIER
ncbi:MAG: hypothetical protein LN413_07410, partial [Candidatus Thermoplasmatota archaeon]|nr:hypothetical protein [Candidatus Thermoplasmatota archaeon]